MPGAWLLKCRSRFSSSFFFGLPFAGEAVIGAADFCFLGETCGVASSCISSSLCAIEGCFRFLEADFGTGKGRLEGLSFVASEFFAGDFAADVVFDFDLVFLYGESPGGCIPMTACVQVSL